MQANRHGHRDPRYSVKSERFFSRILKKGDLEKVTRVDLEAKDFSGDAEDFFLSMEGRRIRFAFQFDPLFAVNVSQIDPLPPSN